ncbi:sigma-70 family RNA polymerase sigma factor [Virgisporangium aurantiacum]|uniref:RNA polymerase sigma24 factor n=1 Tax=Virgisporangium aurantiacum TaxID=175570 RepID=A0A8J3Z5D1_9ACTN|nr:sigma-70 family RNA polymerase sigma factor [Virgisporangium aurantiacum]GIJ57197.1 RNA polymerase sigma24 factor [Virgisporangium aurantiacum]
MQDVAVELAARRDEAFDRVYAAQYSTLVRLAYLTTGNAATAEDVAQDAFADWLRRFSEVRDPAAYLRRAVVSRCTSWVRRRVLERRHGSVPPIGASDRAATAPDADTAAVRAALGRLNPRQRAAVFLRFYLDLPEAEIAAALGCRPGTVKSLLHRSFGVLREHLDEH